MKRLLTLADYDHPYLTMTPEYEQTAVLEVFAALLEQGIVYRALKPVHWSIANQTALAEAELEYEDREDPSIYVDFEAATATRWRVSSASPLDADAVVHDLDDDAVDAAGEPRRGRPRAVPLRAGPGGRQRHRARERAGRDASPRRAARATSRSSPRRTGRELAGPALQASLLRSRVSRSSLADYVTLEDGTGLVHTAPGHGAEDYAHGAARRAGRLLPGPRRRHVRRHGAEWLRGKSVWEANDLVVEHLRESGHLFHDHTVPHSYPHDWRSKTPVIFRATEQWFINVDKRS